MVAGTLMLTDSVNNSFDELFTEANAHIDVTVTPQGRGRGRVRRGTSPARCRSRCSQRSSAVDGVEQARRRRSPTTRSRSSTRTATGSGRLRAAAAHRRQRPPPERRSTPSRLIEGSRPAAGRDEVAIDSITAEEEDYEIGDTIRVAGAAGESRVHDLAGSASSDPASARRRQPRRVHARGGAAADRQGGQARRDRRRGGRRASTPEELAQRFRARVPDTVDVRTGEPRPRPRTQATSRSGFCFLTTALLVFAGIAVFVGAFLIFNTFSITVAQRAREFAMLRTLGASSRQVLAAVLLEAALVGLLASLARDRRRLRLRRADQGAVRGDGLRAADLGARA